MTGIIGFTMVSCNGPKSNQNPLLVEYTTPYNSPPFDRIEREHFIPAIDSAMAEARADIEAILNCTEEPTFANTIEALAFAGQKLGDITTIAFNLNYAETDAELQKVVREVAPKLTDFQNDINLNEKLFARVKQVYGSVDKNSLTAEQLTLLDKTYKGFVRSGANLSENDKQKYREVTRQLSEQSLQFEENVLAETNAYFLHLTKEDELAGLPKSLVDAAAQAAQQKNIEGWVITLDMPMFAPFIKYSERRNLREKIYREYSKRGFNGNENDNTELVKSIVNFRLELANWLGYKSYADYVLENRMAESSDKVMSFLERLLVESLPAANDELQQVQMLAKEMGVNHSIEKWDWAFYTEKLNNKLFNFNE